ADKDPDVVATFPISRNGRPIILPVKIGDKTYPFQFDTGASQMVYDRELQPRLGAPVGIDQALFPEGNVAIPKYRSIEAHLGNLSIKTDDPVNCEDLSHFTRGDYFPVIRGILGMKPFMKHIVQIDFDEGRFSILKPSRNGRENWGSAIPFHYDST